MSNVGNARVKDIFLLQTVLLVNSACGIFTKMAAAYPVLSFAWIALYGLSLLFLGGYALLWQQVLKKVPLMIAFCNKAVGIIWGMFFGALIFQETITVKMILGALIVLVGVIVVVVDE